VSSADRDKIIAKVKKCLALAKSSNEHEAAAALRQAQKLMQAHGIDDLDIEHADIQEERTRAGAIKTPAMWEGALAECVARAFDCVVYLHRIGFVAHWVFVGATPSGEIARYAFEVLFRQIKKARADYIKFVLKRCTKTRTRRADLFCKGWVVAATALVRGLAGNEAARERAMAYLHHQHTLTQHNSRDRNEGRRLSEREYGDMDAGHRAGRDAQLNRGLNGAGGQLALGVQ